MSLAEALASLVTQMGDVLPRDDENAVWWTAGEGKEERDAALREEYEDWLEQEKD